ncbi:MAG: hypothetical protein PHW79_11720 [Candidatus Marinimicrobia bacterium]|nr:hypothetical protein [Candidatus Neomarinimicrobiota bacterium]
MKRQTAILLILIGWFQLLTAQTLDKIADIFSNPTEYRMPLLMTPFEFKVGTQLVSLYRSPLYFDSTETSLVNSDQLYYRSLYRFELDLLKFNFLRYIVPQNLVDFQTGIGGSYTTPLARLNLPDGWNDVSPKDETRLFYSPRILELNVNQSVIFQWSERFCNTMQFNYGKSLATAYRSLGGDRFLDQEKTTWSVAVGMKVFIRKEERFKEAYGVEVKYISANFDRLADSKRLSPITGMNFNSLGIYLTFSSMFGGYASVGDDAKNLYESGDYIAAKANFEQLLQDIPNHPRRFRVRRMIQQCINQMPLQNVAIAEGFIEARNFTKAANYLDQAKMKNLAGLDSVITEDFKKITEIFIHDMDSLFLVNQVDAAEDLLKKVEILPIPDITDLANEYWSEIYFHRGALFTEYGIWDKAVASFDMAVKKHPSIRERVDPWLLKIAFGYINDANKSIDEKDVALALESLQQATRVRPDIQFITKEPIQLLEDGVRALQKEMAIQKLKETSRQRIPVAPKIQPEPELGMEEEMVLEMLDHPSTITQYTDHLNHLFQLWIYCYTDGSEKQYYFRDGILFKIETEKTDSSE